jgi:hypothetical protein
LSVSDIHDRTIEALENAGITPEEYTRFLKSLGKKK